MGSRSGSARRYGRPGVSAETPGAIYPGLGPRHVGLGLLTASLVLSGVTGEARRCFVASAYAAVAGHPFCSLTKCCHRDTTGLLGYGVRTRRRASAVRRLDVGGLDWPFEQVPLAVFAAH